MRKKHSIISFFLTLSVIFSCLVTPSAHSLLYGIQSETNLVNFVYSEDLDINVIEDIDMVNNFPCKSHVRVQNIGSDACFVKATVVYTLMDADSYSLKISDEDSSYDVSMPNVGEIGSNADWIKISENNEEYYANDDSIWIPQTYVYTKPLNPRTTDAPGEITSDLIESLSWKSGSNVRVDFVVEAYSVSKISAWINFYNNANTTSSVSLSESNCLVFSPISE